MPKPSAPPPEVAELSFDRRYLREGRHSVFLFLPEAYHAPIGLIIAYWGNFENAFDACLSGLIEGEMASGGSRETTGWRRSNFRKRRRLFKSICGEWLATKRAEQAAALRALADTAGDLAWKRKLIAHGFYTYTIPANSSSATDCRAKDPETGAEFSFDADALKKLHHDISHLTADLVQVFRSLGSVDGPFVLVPDAELLRVFRESGRP